MSSNGRVLIVEDDPAIREMVAEYHQWYGSAAVMMIPDVHERITAPAAE